MISTNYTVGKERKGLKIMQIGITLIWFSSRLSEDIVTVALILGLPSVHTSLVGKIE